MRAFAFWLFVIYLAAMVYGIAQITPLIVALAFAVFVALPGIALWAAALTSGDEH